MLTLENTLDTGAGELAQVPPRPRIGPPDALGWNPRAFRHARSRSIVAWIAFVLFGASGPLLLPADLLGATKESPWQWRGAVPVEKQVQVLAVRGTVRVEGYDGDTVEVVARRRSADVDPEVVHLVMNDTANEFQIITQYPPPPLGPPRECLWYDPVRGNFWDYFVTVELSLRIPRQQRISVHTYAGDILVTNLESSVVAATNDGTIRLKQLEGPIEARAMGSIDADLRHPGLGRHSILLSVNGGTADITVNPLDRLRLEERLIVPDVTKPLVLVHAEGPFPATVTGTLMESERALTVQVKRGEAQLRSILPSPPER